MSDTLCSRLGSGSTITIRARGPGSRFSYFYPLEPNHHFGGVWMRNEGVEESEWKENFLINKYFKIITEIHQKKDVEHLKKSTYPTLVICICICISGNKSSVPPCLHTRADSWYVSGQSWATHNRKILLQLAHIENCKNVKKIGMDIIFCY